MIHTASFGRASGLAIALGIGAAVAAGGAGVASAEPANASSSPSGSASQSATHRPDTPRRGPRAVTTARRPAGPMAAGKPGPRVHSDLSTRLAGPGSDSPGEPPERQAVRDLSDGLGDPVSAPATVAAASPEPDAVSNAREVVADASPPIPVESPAAWVMVGNTPRVLERPQAAAKPAEEVSTGQEFGAVAAARAPSDPISAFFGGLAAFFNNRTPRLNPTQVGQGPAGVVTGELNPVDPDSPYLTFAVSTQPIHGSVAVNPDGSWAYTPDQSVAATGTTDSFRVTVSDAASGFAIHGLSGLINMLTFGLLGERGDSSTATVAVTVAPFNSRPTGYAIVGDPDPGTGAVNGTVVGSDIDGDALTYSGSGATAKGTVFVSASGDFSYLPTAEALAIATAPFASATDKRDVFNATIEDGRGGSVVVSVTVRLVLTEDLSTFCGCTLMPANSIFHADVRNLAVLPKSDTWTTLLGAERGGTLIARWAGEPWMGSTGGMPVNIVSATYPTETVIFNRGYSTSGPSIDDSPYAIPDRPLVEGMPDVPAWDRHLLVFQEGTCISQELYNVANGVELPAAGIGDALANAAYAAVWGSSWIAEAGVRYDMSNPLYPAQGWANASRLPYLPLILRPDELERGSIDHMLGIVIAKDKGTGYAWPARSGDGTGTNPDGVPMGTVFRLRADFNITGYDPATQVVLRALQDHGAVVYDSFGPGLDGAGLLAMSNGWTGTGYITAKQELSTIPIGAFEAVDVLSLAADPTTGWVIQSTTV